MREGILIITSVVRRMPFPAPLASADEYGVTMQSVTWTRPIFLPMNRGAYQGMKRKYLPEEWERVRVDLQIIFFPENLSLDEYPGSNKSYLKQSEKFQRQFVGQFVLVIENKETKDCLWVPLGPPEEAEVGPFIPGILSGVWSPEGTPWEDRLQARLLGTVDQGYRSDFALGTREEVNAFRAHLRELLA